MLESAIDLQFETLTTFFNDGGQPVTRSASNNAHAYLGIRTEFTVRVMATWRWRWAESRNWASCWVAMPLLRFTEPAEWFSQRDAIKSILAEHLSTNVTAHWLSALEPADIWCADVLDWKRLLEHDAFKSLEMFQKIKRVDRDDDSNHTMSDSY